MKYCCVCKVPYSPLDTHSLHALPKDIELRNKWIEAISLLPETFNVKNVHICSDHFKNDSFYQTFEGHHVRRLLPSAVPSVPLMDPNAEVTQATRSTSTSKDETLSSTVHRAALSEALSVDDGSACISENQKAESSIHIQNLDANADTMNPTKYDEFINSSGHSVPCTTDSSQASLGMDDGSGTKKRKRTDDEDNRCFKRVRFANGSNVYFLSRKDFSSDEAWEKFVIYTRLKNSKTAAAHSKSYRKKKKILSLKGMVEVLRKKNETGAVNLLKDLPPHLQERIKRIKNNKKTVAFSPALKTFARTLHFYSPSAYNVVRESFLKCLPSVQTLGKWLKTDDFKPGISHEIIKVISEVVKKEKIKGKKIAFNLTFDEMGIKQNREWDKNTHTWRGLVDAGGHLVETDANGQSKTASKAFVFVLVSVNGGFKAAVAYYFINSLNGTEKSILLKDLLIVLGENEIDVVGVTFDGDPAHKTACESLGANLNYTNSATFKPFFEHPLSGTPVYIFYDACHCLKLVRNYLAAHSPFIDDNNRTVHWRFIVRMNDKQNTEKLHSANKVTNRHVFFTNEKMKVFLAAQTLSRSTACSLKFLEDELGDKQFTGAQATAEFCKNFDEIFDLLNVRSAFSKNPTRVPLSAKSFSEIEMKVNQFVSYIESLKFFKPLRKTKNNLVDQGKQRELVSVVKSKTVRTGFIGFIISLKNLCSLASYLITNHYLDYLLSYKLSQDHVELLFSLIRRMNGHNNNPTTVQYMSAYKKLVSHKITSITSKSANCLPLDTTLLISKDENIDEIVECKKHGDIQSSKTIYTPKSSKSTVAFPKSNYSSSISDYVPRWVPDISTDHDYFSSVSPWSAGEYLTEIIAYMAGSIVKVLKEKIHCEPCLQLLSGSPVMDESKLISLKNWGGLNIASNDIQLICQTTETVIRMNKHLFETNIFTKLAIKTLQTLPGHVLNDRHFLEQELMMDHRSQLILLVIGRYLDMRLKHEGKLLSSATERIRMKNNKITIFKGQ